MKQPNTDTVYSLLLVWRQYNNEEDLSYEQSINSLNKHLNRLKKEY